MQTDVATDAKGKPCNAHVFETFDECKFLKISIHFFEPWFETPSEPDTVPRNYN